MTTSDDSIVAFIKEVRAQDRRADRERIAELERDLAAHFASVEATLSNWQTIIDDLNKQVDELTEKCAALVVENKRLREDAAPTLRIDPDMSDPQPGKLLVVRVAEWDIHSLRLPSKGLSFFTTQFVGFLVETPAVEVKRTPKVGDRVRVRDEVGVVVQVGITTAAVRFRDNDECPFLIAEIEVIE